MVHDSGAQAESVIGQATPGPWRLDGEGVRAMVRGADMTIVAVRHRLPREIHEANARLIAAAPDLLKAIKVAREYVVRIDGTLAFTAPEARVTRPDLNLIDAAIAKATGATS